jgi:hypothetical protein
MRHGDHLPPLRAHPGPGDRGCRGTSVDEAARRRAAAIDWLELALAGSLAQDRYLASWFGAFGYQLAAGAR